MPSRALAVLPVNVQVSICAEARFLTATAPPCESTVLFTSEEFCKVTARRGQQHMTHVQHTIRHRLPSSGKQPAHFQCRTSTQTRPTLRLQCMKYSTRVPPSSESAEHVSHVRIFCGAHSFMNLCCCCTQRCRAALRAGAPRAGLSATAAAAATCVEYTPDALSFTSTAPPS